MFAEGALYLLRPGRWVFCSIFARVAYAGETSVPTAQRARVLRVEVAARMRRSEMMIGNGPRFRRAGGSSGLYLVWSCNGGPAQKGAFGCVPMLHHITLLRIEEAPSVQLVDASK